MNMNRRRFLITLSAGSALSHLRYVSAQEKSFNVSEAIAKNKENAKALLAEITKSAPRLNNDLAASFARRDAALRLELHRVLAHVSSKDLYAYVLPNQKKLADSFRKTDVSLFPEKDEIKAQFVPMEQPSKKCGETVFSVSVDIFMEGLGLQDIAAAMKEVVKKSPEIQNKINELAHALQLRDWEQVIDLVKTIMDLLSKVGLANLFAEVLGLEEGRKVWERFLRKLGARFVPFVGQLYTAISIGVALFNNSERLLHAIECSETVRSNRVAGDSGVRSI